MKLTDTAIRKSKPEPRPFKMTDGGGLFLLVQLNGSRYWRLAYRFEGKQSVGIDISQLQVEERFANHLNRFSAIPTTILWCTLVQWKILLSPIKSRRRPYLRAILESIKIFTGGCDRVSESMAVMWMIRGDGGRLYEKFRER